MIQLGVNIDHIATIRQARLDPEPDPVAAAVICELAGAHQITVHLRGDRRHIQDRDLRLLRETVKSRLNLEMSATAEMVPISWPEFADLHPFAPSDQTRGYAELFDQLEAWLCEITGLEGCSLQPNAGSQGEYAGLRVIAAWHADRGQAGRNVCLIPASAHGTNPASATIAGYEVISVACDDQGNIDLKNLKARAEEHHQRLICLTPLYPT